MGWMSQQETHRGVVVEFIDRPDQGRRFGFIEAEDAKPGDHRAWVWFGERAIEEFPDIGRGDVVNYVLFGEQRQRPDRRLAAVKVWIVERAA